MGGIRLNSEKKIDCEDFKIKIGTTNKINPLVVYVEGRAFISPSEAKDDYARDISEIKYVFKQSIREHLHENKQMFDSKFIVDFQVATNGIAVGKKSFLSFQFLMRQNAGNVKRLIDVKQDSSQMILDIVEDLKNVIIRRDFVISKTKK